MKQLLIALVLILALSADAQGIFRRADRFRVGQASSETLLLDSVTNLATIAVSVSRRLRSAYSGNAFTAIKFSDGSTNNIGFSGNNVDTNALATFASGADVGVQILYDQSGNGNNMEAAGGATNVLPLVWKSSTGMVTTSSGALAAEFDGSDDNIRGSSISALPITFFGVVANITSTVNNDSLINLGSTSRGNFRQKSTGPGFEINSGALLAIGNYTLGTWYVIRCSFVTGTSDAGQINAGSETVGNAGDNAPTSFILGQSTVCPTFRWAESVVFEHTPIAADIGTIVTNTMTYYGL